VDPWVGATTDAEYDSDWYGLFHGASAGTLSDPADLNSTAGTAEDHTALAFSGAAQTSNNLPILLGTVGRLAGAKIDYTKKIPLPLKKRYIGMHPICAEILKNAWEILDDTSGHRATESTYVLLENSGYTIIEDAWFDADYAGADDGASTLTFFYDPGESFVLWVVPNKGQTWSAWVEREEKTGKKWRLFYEKHKKIEIAVRPKGYFIQTTSTAAAFYKKCLRVNIDPYATS
jgi:hypothetical protein